MNKIFRDVALVIKGALLLLVILSFLSLPSILAVILDNSKYLYIFVLYFLALSYFMGECYEKTNNSSD